MSPDGIEGWTVKVILLSLYTIKGRNLELDRQKLTVVRSKSPIRSMEDSTQHLDITYRHR